ncbi:hypothetical protein EV203_1507 [Caldanaerobacter subterraneus]|jgi:hypothetical protein|uniref:Uncharacterized protein n=1 Tax=Caldanaerobacter subterraneus TaxID=911092 RepID=A0A4R2JCL6_9THEO|nr:hypothetical protein EV203_1507 [Caldanaerobacter subterraneus]
MEQRSKLFTPVTNGCIKTVFKIRAIFLKEFLPRKNIDKADRIICTG